MARERLNPASLATTEEELLATTQRAIDISPPAYFRRKGVVDRVMAALLLIPALPLTLLLVVIVRLTSPGPGLYRQTRVGLNGRIYAMYKIRSMVENAEVSTGPVWAAVGDPRITRVGRLLRKLHLDELPQLFNVLRGDMVLIGPRPERPELMHRLAADIPGYLNRLAVAPGITGLAQVNLPPDATLDDVRRKLALDLEYVHDANLLLDLRLLACTVLKLLGLPTHHSLRALGLQRYVHLDHQGRAHVSRSPVQLKGHSPAPGGGNGKLGRSALEETQRLSALDTQRIYLADDSAPVELSVKQAPSEAR